MSNILLVEPDYRSKFPPLGLLRLATYHKRRGDRVTFTRGTNETLRGLAWHRVYVSSLFTYELPRTVRTVKYYRPAVDADDHIIVGGIGATLLPSYVKANAPCRVVVGPLDAAGILDGEKTPIANLTPDYSLIDAPEWTYLPKDSYFCRATTGCIRHCPFCAVPTLEPTFAECAPLKRQIAAVKREYGERQHLVVLDNNVLASPKVREIIADIREAGFEKGARRNNKQRTVDFNQGIDARLITEEIAELLSTIALSPIRLAFDYAAIKPVYERAIARLTRHGFDEFTNYVMYNFKDTPRDFYERIRLNTRLSKDHGIRITGFPMKFSPITEVTRRHVDPGWHWRYLRGMQCVLLATHGLVSPNPVFFEAAFGASYSDFLEILSMPDRYIIHRKKYKKTEAKDWQRLFRSLSRTQRQEFLGLLATVNRLRKKEDFLKSNRSYRALFEHYYPGGKPTPCQ